MTEAENDPTAKTIGIYIYPNMTMLDGYGPQQIFGLTPGLRTYTFARSMEPVVSDTGVALRPDFDFSTCPDADVLLVPGSGDPTAEMQDDAVLETLRRMGERAAYVTSVCTGGLILAEAGLLNGYRATTHWAYKKYLELYPDVSVVDARVVVDRNRITGGGITAGIDFAFTLIAQLLGPEVAQAMQLVVEYAPAPPFDTGSPESAPPALVDLVYAQMETAFPGPKTFFANKAR